MTFSIIIPVYNPGPYLRECLDSLLAMTVTDYELILVDDGSTDGSGEVCDDFANGRPWVRVVHQPNRGVIAARRYGTALSKGEWIVHYDADDTVPADALERMLAVSEGHDIVVGHFHPTPLKGDEMSIEEYRRFTILNDDTIPVSTWSRIYRRSLFEGYDPFGGTPVGEDWLMNVRLSFRTDRSVGLIPDVIYNYRIRTSTSMCRSHRSSPEFMEEMRSYLIGAIPEGERRRYVKETAQAQLALFERYIHSNPGDGSYRNHPFYGHLISDMAAGGVDMPSFLAKILARGNSWIANRFVYWFLK